MERDEVSSIKAQLALCARMRDLQTDVREQDAFDAYRAQLEAKLKALVPELPQTDRSGSARA
jgi:hypothetical protein